MPQFSEVYATRFKEMYPFSLRDVARHIALRELAFFYKSTGRMEQLRKNRIQFLSFHHILDDEEPNFRKLINLLRRGHKFISYSEAVGRILTGTIDDSYIVFTFDDGLKNCLQAAKILKDLGIGACFFLCCSMMGESDYSKIKSFCSEKLDMPPVRFLSWDEVEKILKLGHEVGSHGMSHKNFAQMPALEQQDDIQKSFEILKKRTGEVKHFSWPYGRFCDFNAGAAGVVFKTGFKTCASAERGCHTVKSVETNFCIRRDHIKINWPVSEIFYFLARSIYRASSSDNLWPQEWQYSAER